MNFEVLNTFASLGTFAVIAATAIAALIQLRHLRASNLLMSMLSSIDDWAHLQPERIFIRNELAAKLEEQSFRGALTENRLTPENAALYAVGNFFECHGILVKNGLLNAQIYLDQWGYVAKIFWEDMATAVALMRRKSGHDFYQNFEYLAVLSRRASQSHSRGTYPPSVERWTLIDKWLDVDEKAGMSTGHLDHADIGQRPVTE